MENDTEDFWEGLCGGSEDVDIYFLMGMFSATIKSGFVLLVFVAGEVLTITGSSAGQMEDQDGKMTISYKEGILPSWIWQISQQ